MKQLFIGLSSMAFQLESLSFIPSRNYLREFIKDNLKNQLYVEVSSVLRDQELNYNI